MDVALDVSAVPLTEEQIQAIVDAHTALIETDVKGDSREVVERIDDKFVISCGLYTLTDGTTFQTLEQCTEALRERMTTVPPLPDPIFGPHDVVPLISAMGARLDCLDAHDENFKEMIEEMFAAGDDIKLTEDAMRQLIEKR